LFKTIFSVKLKPEGEVDILEKINKREYIGIDLKYTVENSKEDNLIKSKNDKSLIISNNDFNKNKNHFLNSNNEDILFGQMVESIIIEDTELQNIKSHSKVELSNDKVDIDFETTKFKKESVFSPKNNISNADIYPINDKNTIDYGNIEEEFFFHKFSENLNLIFSKGVLKLQYSESKPFFLRKIFYDQMIDIFTLIPLLKDINFFDLKFDSWFSIMWNPYKSSKNIFNNTSFISFYNIEIKKNHGYQLNKNNDHSDKKFIQKAILPLKFQKEIFTNFQSIILYILFMQLINYK